MLQRKKQQEAEEQHSQWCTSTVSCHQLSDPIATDIQNFALPIIDNDIICNPIKGFIVVVILQLLLPYKGFTKSFISLY